MAEGFARAYGSDVMVPLSAGVAPAASVAPFAIKIMREKNIDIEGAIPKGLDAAMKEGPLDLIVNITGRKLPMKLNTPIEDWPVRDPVGEKEPVFRDAAAEIENRVMRLVINLRNRRSEK
jgi:protein-tyrosine-phosphatase